ELSLLSRAVWVFPQGSFPTHDLSDLCTRSARRSQNPQLAAEQTVTMNRSRMRIASGRASLRPRLSMSDVEEINGAFHDLAVAMI
ncbi:MAG: hypothetical protein P8M80_06410, partial [Pirellulaceae bacterium]|nr:hypothetical protein [Pirellulaceae bacterium]